MPTSGPGDRYLFAGCVVGPPLRPSPATRLRRVGGRGLEVMGLRRRGSANPRTGGLPSFPCFGHFVSPAGVLAVAAGEGGEVAEPPLERETGAGE